MYIPIALAVEINHFEINENYDNIHCIFKEPQQRFKLITVWKYSTSCLRRNLFSLILLWWVVLSCFVSLRLNFERVNRYCENISRCERRRRQCFDRRTILNVWRGFWSYRGDKMERSRVQTVLTKRCHGRGSKESHTSRHRCPAWATEITRAEIQRFVIVGLFMFYI